MAKKFVRGITDVKTITNQCYDTNNVNDLLSDGQYNYIHRKKGETEEYHNLTDNIKTISSDNTELLSVTNNNKTTNTATLHPKHDAQKEQVLESTRNTVNIQHGTNGTDGKTTVDTNPQKVLEHENLISDSEYITLNHQSGENVTHIKTAALKQELNELHQKHDAQKEQLLESTRNTISINHGGNGTAEKTNVDTNPQKVLEHENLISDSEYITLDHQTDVNKTHIKTESLKQELQQLHQTKQDTLTAGEGITIEGQTISYSGTTSSIEYRFSGENFQFFKHVVKGRYDTSVTYTFDCDPTFTEDVFDVNLKNDLEKYVRAGMTVSNGAISLTNDGTNMKLIKSGGSQNVIQQGTFKFYRSTGGEPGGGGGAD